jgi:hypothetical protein
MRCARAVGSRQFAPGVRGRQSCIPQIPPGFGELRACFAGLKVEIVLYVLATGQFEKKG